MPQEFARGKSRAVSGLVVGVLGGVLGLCAFFGVFRTGPGERYEYETEDVVISEAASDTLEVKAPAKSTRRTVVVRRVEADTRWSRVFGAVMVALAAYCLYVAMWGTVVPYARIWREGLRVAVDPWRTERVYWSTVSGVTFKEGKVVFDLPGGETQEISLRPLPPASRKEIREIILGQVKHRPAKPAGEKASEKPSGAGAGETASEKNVAESGSLAAAGAAGEGNASSDAEKPAGEDGKDEAVS